MRGDGLIDAATVDTGMMSIDPKAAAKSKAATAMHSKPSCKWREIIIHVDRVFVLGSLISLVEHPK
jgi:hypothetical protein